MGWCICAPCFTLLVTRDRRLCTHLGSWGFMRRRFSPFINPTALPRWMAPIRAKQLSVAATARMIWLCASVRYWPGRGLVYVCPLRKVCTIFKVIFANASSIYGHQLLYLMTFLNKLNSARIGKIFACWQLAIVITSSILEKGLLTAIHWRFNKL